MSRAAFFDVDNTLIKGSVLFQAGAGLIRHGLVTRRQVGRHAAQHLGYRWRGERADQLGELRDRALTFGAGLDVTEVVRLGEMVFDERLAGRIFDGTQRLVDRHLAVGDQVWLATGAPIELADILARRLGLTGALGSVGEVSDGKWTGRLVGDLLHGPAKAAAVIRLADDRGYDLVQCVAYSDSINDLPLLEAVGSPHAVNPDRALRRIAVERAWPVHDFRARGRLTRTAPS